MGLLTKSTVYQFSRPGFMHNQALFSPTKLRDMNNTLVPITGGTADDIICLEPCAAGPRITWTLQLRMHGVAKATEPFLVPLLNRLADKALDGLKEDLDG